MTDLSKVVCLVVDTGPFQWVAHHLAKTYAKVYYTDPTGDSAFTGLDHDCTGDGYEDIQRVKEIEDVIERVDLAVFTDTGYAAKQDFIARVVGVPVWGARSACEMETKKVLFRATQRHLGMETPRYEVVRGIERLREFSRDHPGWWVKISPQRRGFRETFQIGDYQATRQVIDDMAYRAGVLQDVLTFLCEQDIKSELEGGIDTYTVDGDHPDHVVVGYEDKDHGYFGAIQRYAQVDSRIRSVNEILWPELRERKCRQMFSTEVKITAEGKSILLEPTLRFPSPAGEEQGLLYKNLAEIIYHGAQGVLVAPQFEETVACEAMIEHKGDCETWRSLVIPDEIKDQVFLYATVKVGKHTAIAPGADIVGAVAAKGSSPSEALDRLKEYAAALKAEPVIVHVEALAKLIEEINLAQEQGIGFSEEPMPEAQEAVI